MLINRRDFFQLSAGACLASSLPRFFSSRAEAEEARKELKVVRFELKVGAEKPFVAIHVSDTHLTFADERETERKQKLAESRLRYFGKSERLLAAAVDYAQEKDAALLHTGDLIDFVSEKNFEYVEKFYADLKLAQSFSSVGNHEFSHYLGEAKEDEAYKLKSFDRVQRAYPCDLRFDSKIVNGVNFVAFDDVYYYVADDLVERMKKEIDKGYPIVTLCHIPFYTPELFKFMLETRKEKCAWITPVPEDVMTEYKQDAYRFQVGNEATIKFVEWLKEQSSVKALLSGHLHVNHEGPFSASARQYVVGGNFKGDVYEFAFE